MQSGSLSFLYQTNVKQGQYSVLKHSKKDKVEGPKLYTAGKNMQASITTNQLMEDNLLEKSAVLDRKPRSKRTRAIIWLAWLHLLLTPAGPRTSRTCLYNVIFEMS